MMMRFLVAGAAMLLLATIDVNAQQAASDKATPAISPVMEHYRAYARARADGDFKRAESEAVAALAQAEMERDVRAGVLAFNLATLRAFELNDLRGAREPAEKALRSSRPEVSSSSARLLMTLAGLPDGQDRVRRDLSAAMLAARADDGVDVEFLYRVARAWGISALAAKQEVSALEAFGHARDLADRMTGDAALERAFARVEMGALLIVRDRERAAFEIFSEAVTILAPLAPESSGERMPAAELLYAQAMTWRSVAWAKAPENERRRMNQAVAERPGLPNALRLCEGRLRFEPKPRFPKPAIDRLGIGAVTLRLSVGPDGQIRRVQVVGAVPKQDFTASVLAVASQWRHEWKEAGAECRRETDDLLVPIRFAFSD